jgi:hypothetical protein
MSRKCVHLDFQGKKSELGKLPTDLGEKVFELIWKDEKQDPDKVAKYLIKIFKKYNVQNPKVFVAYTKDYDLTINQKKTK